MAYVIVISNGSNQTRGRTDTSRAVLHHDAYGPFCSSPNRFLLQQTEPGSNRWPITFTARG